MKSKLGFARPAHRTPFVLLAGALVAFGVLGLFGGGGTAEAQSLRPTPGSLDRQNRQADHHRYTYLETPAQVIRFVDLGYLVEIRGNGDYQVKEGVRFPYARPEVRTFLERFGKRFHEVCREPLVVTSLTRPRTRQPRNASSRSVHPTGMAMDLRLPWSRRCRGWAEGVLYNLEAEGLLEANRERRPPHYHVALFPAPYMDYVARVERGEASPEDRLQPAVRAYRVQRGDTLWRIARRHGISVDRIRAVNSMGSDRIRAGQVLDIPAN
ncbi:MAG: DUF5715 family protein [Acidobacteriota bacterium]|jgi:hypothetical protein